MSLWLQSPCFSPQPHEFSHESHTIHWDLLIESMLLMCRTWVSKIQRTQSCGLKSQVRCGGMSYLEKLNIQTNSWSTGLRVRGLHTWPISATSVVSPWPTYLTWTELQFSYLYKESNSCHAYILWLLCDSELMLVKYCYLHLGEKNELLLSCSIVRCLPCQISSVLIAGHMLLFLFIMWILLKEVTGPAITLFFSLSSMHDKMGKCVNSLWFFYLWEGFLNAFELHLCFGFVTFRITFGDEEAQVML